MKLSVIIALYNTEEYIEKCVRSVAKQNISANDYEIIIVNDGSTDSSLTIAEKLQQEYRNIFVFSKANGGQSSARNLGFQKAKGDYIFCLDSDDFISENSLKQPLHEIFEHNLDMLSYSFERVAENGLILNKNKENYLEFEGVISGAEFMNRFAVSGTMWMYFYKRDLIEKNQLRLTEGIYHEDEEFVILYLSYAERVKHVDLKFYNYLIRSNSTVNNKSKEHRLKLLNDIIVVIEHLENRLTKIDEINDNLLYRGIAVKKEQLLVSICLRLIKQDYSKKNISDILDVLQKKGYYPVNLKYSKWSFKLFVKFINNRNRINFLSRILK